MASITIFDVPDDAHEVLARRARSSGMTVQEYVRDRLVDEAQRPTIDEVLGVADEPPLGALFMLRIPVAEG